MIVVKRDWNEYNTKLVNRGKPSTYLGTALERQEMDLVEMNRSKRGSPYRYSFMLIFAAFAIKAVDKKSYRAAAGAVEDFIKLSGKSEYPNFRTIHWRVKQLAKNGIKLMIYRSIGEEVKNIDVIIDSTGMKSRKDGEYRSSKYGKIKMWKQMHIVISRKTHKILNMKVTREHAGDPNQFVDMIRPIARRQIIRNAYADGAYGSNENFGFCGAKGIRAIIPVRINSFGKRDNKFRKHAIEEQFKFQRRPYAHRKYWYPNENKRRENQELWKKESGYHQRSLVETVNSVFKNVFDEGVFSKRAGMIEKELLLKAVVYNTFIV